MSRRLERVRDIWVENGILEILILIFLLGLRKVESIKQPINQSFKSTVEGTRTPLAMGPAVHPSRAEQVVGVTPTDGVGTRHARQQGERPHGSQIKKELKRITGLFRPGSGNASVP